MRIVTPQDAPLETVRDLLARIDADGGDAPHELPVVTQETQRIRTFFMGDERSPSLMEVVAPPNKPEDAHAHDVDEVKYVLEGEFVIGDRTYGPGTAVHIPAGTLYSIKVGPNGARYLNMRPVRDTSYVSRSEHAARRTAARDQLSP